MAIAILCLAFIGYLGTMFSCEENECWSYHYDWGFKYKVKVNHTTPGGIKVDNSGQKLHDNFDYMLDRLTNETLECLKKEFPIGDLTEIQTTAFCYQNKSFDLKIDKNCLKIKIPNNWFWSRDKTQQFLTDISPDSGCLAKGFSQEDINKYGCYWRVGLQDGHIIITPPNLYLYKDALIKYITGCDNIWHTKKLAKCASPGFSSTWELEGQ